MLLIRQNPRMFVCRDILTSETPNNSETLWLNIMNISCQKAYYLSFDMIQVYGSKVGELSLVHYGIANRSFMNYSLTRSFVKKFLEFDLLNFREY